jgi:hypothetical protein
MKTPTSALRRRGQALNPAPARQRGAATLVIVMLLFFVLSLTAAYTARNLVFEQRTAANLYRATQSFEAAEAGLDWALAQLNGPRVDTDCLPTADPTLDTFRARYLALDANTGNVTRVPRAGFAATSFDAASYRWAACVFDGTDWVCRCPGDALPTLPTATTGPGPYPAFAVRFENQAARPGLTRLEVNGCTSADPACLFAVRASAGAMEDCRFTVCSLAVLHGALRVPPPAALTVRGGVSNSSAAFTIVNQDPASGGFTVRSGQAAPAVAPQLRSAPGTPAQGSALWSDPALTAELDADSPDCAPCLFSATFGVRPETYRLQPAVLEIDCSAGCTGATVNTLRAGQPGRPLWLRGAGGLTLGDPADSIGDATDPVVLVAEGPVVLTAAATVHGLVYAATATLADGAVRGALVVAGALDATGPATVTYDPAALTRLQLTQGSFVRVPNGWRDVP